MLNAKVNTIVYVLRIIRALPLYPHTAHATNLEWIFFQNFASRTDTIFCGVFDGHGPYGHMVAKRVRDSLPLKLSAQWEVHTKTDDVLREISLNGTGSLNSESTSFLNADEEPRASVDVEETENHTNIFKTLKESFLKAYKVMDRQWNNSFNPG